MDAERFSHRVPWSLARPSSDPHYLLYCRAYAVATGLRLTLPDATDAIWLGPALLGWAGAILLFATGSFVGWCACALAAWIPILFLQDQLSQSTYLGFVALAALASFAGRLERDLPRTVRILTIGVYAFAGLHKLNRDYFNPVVSCANEGLRVLAERSPGVVPDVVSQTFDSALWPAFHIAIELGIVVLLLFRPRVGIVLAAAMHIPLTIIFAPGFAFTMMSGWLAFFSYDELRQAVAIARKRWPLAIAVAAPLAAASRAMLFPGRWSSDPDWCVKEAIVWSVAAILAVVLPSLPRSPRRWRWPHLPASVFVGAFVANGLTPYFGAQLHHTAAMLSNLRIDEGCHNSLLFPDALATDPYVRLDEVDFAPHRADDETRRAMTARLWAPASLEAARNSWCEIHEEPLPIRGHYRGRPFATDDACAHWPLPPPLLPGFRRFQTNLKRTCPQRCLH